MLTTVRGVAARVPSLHVAANYARMSDWCIGAVRPIAQRQRYAAQWHRSNHHDLTATGPLWVVLGDSAAQGLGASTFRAGYIGQAHKDLIQRTGQPWRVVNLSRSGATTKDVLHTQLSVFRTLNLTADLLTCGVGTNDIIKTDPARLHATMRELIGALPKGAIMLDLPLPEQFWGIIGRHYLNHVSDINTTIHRTAQQYGVPVVRISAHFTPPWTGMFCADHLHLSDDGHRTWATPLVSLIAPVPSSACSGWPSRHVPRG